jgi:hypothetical protein
MKIALMPDVRTLFVIDKQMGKSPDACLILNAFKAKLLSIGEMA